MRTMKELRTMGPRVAKHNAEQVWKEFEDYLAPLLGLKAGERAVYSYLVRHSRLEGRPGVVMSMPGLARGAAQCLQSARVNVMRLVRKKCALVQPYRKQLYAIQVFLPAEVLRAIRPRDFGSITLRVLWVSKNRVLREAILRRERRRCFYCRQRLLDKPNIWFDHIVPLSRGGSPDEENVVACCRQCNRRKMTQSAQEYLRKLVREGTLTKEQMKRQLALAKEYLSGKAGLARAA